MGLLDRLTDDDAVEAVFLENVIPTADTYRWVEFLSIRTDKQLSELVSCLNRLNNVSVIHHSTSNLETNIVSVLVYADEPNHHVLTTLAVEKCIPFRLRAQADGLHVDGAVENWDVLKAVGNAIENEYQRFELLGVQESDRIRRPFGGERLKHAVGDELTAQQMHLLREAYGAGYFQVPKQTTSDELADQFDMSQSTFSEQVRNAQDELLTVLFGSSL